LLTRPTFHHRLLSHADYEVLDFVGGAWPTDSALGAAVILFGNQLAMPGQQCVRRNQVGNFVQYSTANKLGFRCQASALIIGKPKPTSAKLLFENPILLVPASPGAACVSPLAELASNGPGPRRFDPQQNHGLLRHQSR
jgi:hypothetical protein